MKKTYNLKSTQSRNINLTKSGDYTIKLLAEGAQANITAPFRVSGTQHLKLNITIIHAAKNTTANTIIKAIADDNSTVEINGTIIVKPGAQLTNSFLSEKVLLLSQKAQAHAIPNLEIQADDVKCSHAAVVTTIDQDQLFYLQSRGLKVSAAKQLIADGFLQIQ